MEIERGVMVMKNGLAWGVSYEDGQSTSYGWIKPEHAPIHNQEFCKKVTDVTYNGSPYEDEINTGKLVVVERITTVHIL